ANSYELWALNDVTFSVKQGEVLGILGANGAGKSTLLKILSRITPPTSGRVEIHGQIGSLLEVGTGFNQDLSGHENIYLYGSILGMERKKIQEKYNEIVEFAELQDFIHQPIKHYSSGMHAKLGFAVASHLDCDILLVDEILAVGDAAFRKKSFTKMTSLINSGKTVLFVSHNMSAINNLCTRAVVLDKGKIVYNGETVKAVEHYLASFGHKSDQLATNPASFIEDEGKILNILGITIRNSRGEVSSRIKYQEKFTVEIDALIREANELFFAIVYFRDVSGQIVVVTTDEDLGPSLMSGLEPGQHLLKVEFPAKLFLPASYRLIVALAKKPGGQIDRRDEAVELVIEDFTSWRSQQDLYRKTAAVAPELEWTSTPVENGNE
ncbi:MAG: ABC transporter ATP-binding protein, partial [Pseudomonadota bacterium]